MIWCLIQFAMGTLNDAPLYAVNAGWSIYNLLLLSVVIRAAVWQPKES
jgi:cellulose synthase (UDP-forming)